MTEHNRQSLLNELYYQVRRMRSTQKTYFRTRDKIVLEQSKAIERQVDSVIAMLDEIENKENTK